MNLIDINEAVALVKQGEVIAIPTDTVYGLVCSISSKTGYEKIYELKNRPKDKPLITFLAFPPPLSPDFQKLAKQFWPGPLTLVIDGESVRIPNHPLALNLIEWAGPLWSTSANVSGEPPPIRVEDITLDIPILRGSLCPIQTPSTVLSETGIIREGAISRSALEAVLQRPVEQIALSQ